MADSLTARRLADPLNPLPGYLVTLMRPEVPGAVVEIISEISGTIPGYAAVLNGPYGDVIRQCVRHNVGYFIARVAKPDVPSGERDDLCRAAGRLEAVNGHSMDRLQTAYRIGVQVAWRRWIKVARRHNIPTLVMTALADALFAYIDEMTALSRAGHAEARAAAGHHLEEYRSQLLAQLVAGEAPASGSLGDLAERAGWRLPEEATMVALSLGPAPALERESLERKSSDQEAMDQKAMDREVLDREALDCDVLADFANPRPHLLIPGAVTPDRERMLRKVLRSGRCVIGLTVPLAEVRHSLRWARQTLTLAEISSDAEALPALSLSRSEDHLLSLWLLSDPELTRRITERQLSPLADLTRAQRKRCTETLLAWLTTRGNVEQMAKSLDVHPQTVRYRMRLLDRTFGALLENPDWRIATELVLRGSQECTSWRS